jgi:hypothetical protein
MNPWARKTLTEVSAGGASRLRAKPDKCIKVGVNLQLLKNSGERLERRVSDLERSAFSTLYTLPSIH